MTDLARSLARRCLLALVLAGGLLPAGGAQAATVAMTPQGLVLDSTVDGDRGGEFVIFPDAQTADGTPTRWRVFAFGCPLKACLEPVAPACALPNAAGIVLSFEVVCLRSAPGVTVRAGGGADQVTVNLGSDPLTADLGEDGDVLQRGVVGGRLQPDNTGPWTVSGGGGDDQISGSLGANRIDAGAGVDTVTTFGADDRIAGGDGGDVIDPGAGVDVVQGDAGDDRFQATVTGGLFERDENAYDGGDGVDTIDYSQREQPVFFSSGATQGGSIPGGLDRVTGVEAAILGAGNDIALSLFESPATRRLEGRDGDDLLAGATSADTLIGGEGRDRLRGLAGDDLIDARDESRPRGEVEEVACGTGTDTALLDPFDADPFTLTACETAYRAPVAEYPLARLVAARRAATGLQVDLTCPATSPRACAGRLDAGGRLGAAYRVSRGGRTTVTIPALGRLAASVRVRSVEPIPGSGHRRISVRTLRVR